MFSHQFGRHCFVSTLCCCPHVPSLTQTRLSDGSSACFPSINSHSHFPSTFYSGSGVRFSREADGQVTISQSVDFALSSKATGRKLVRFVAVENINNRSVNRSQTPKENQTRRARTGEFSFDQAGIQCGSFLRFPSLWAEFPGGTATSVGSRALHRAEC